MAALRVLAAAGCPIETMRAAELDNWIWLVHCMSLLSGPNQDPHSVSIEARPGRVLERSGYNEFRLRQLLGARRERFQSLLERAVRRTARFGGPLNWTKLAPLILPSDPESRWAEHARVEITRDFAMAAARSDPRKAVS
jgi:hypothetical protein